jgi:hypothetical protein
MRLVKRTLYVALVSLFSLVSLCGLLTLGSTPAHAADVVLDEARFVQRMNADRAAAGVPPLVVLPRLIEIARVWSRVLSDRSTSLTECTLSHNQNLLEVLRPASKVAENVGCGDGTADELHDAFMNSPHHRTNILDPAFDSVGVGVFMSGETLFVSVEFVRTVVVLAPRATVFPLPALVPVPSGSTGGVGSEKPASASASRLSSGKAKNTKIAPKVTVPKVAPKKVAGFASPPSLKLSNPQMLVAKRATALALRPKRASRLFRSAHRLTTSAS